MTGQGRVHWGLLGLFQESVEGSAQLEGSLEGLFEGSLGFIQGGYFRSPLGVCWRVRWRVCWRLNAESV